MIIKAFKNGNFNVKSEGAHDSDLISDLCNAHELDFKIAGDEGCAGNYDMYYPLYNHYTDLLYLPTGKDCSDYLAGKTVKLVGRTLDNDEREALEGEGVI